MFLTGVLYLLFENTIIGQLSSSKGSGSVNNIGSRVIMGMQVRFSYSRMIGLEY